MTDATAEAAPKLWWSRISEEFLHRLKARGKSAAAAQRQNLFMPAGELHPKGVAPPSEMAMDDWSNGCAQWADGGWAQANTFNSAFLEGTTFLGYPFLSELAQRAEYRRISEVIATEMTRKWIRITATGDEDKSEKVEQLTQAMDHLCVRDAFRRCAEQDGFFGRGHIYLDFGTGDEPDELKMPIGGGWDNISQAKIKKGSLKALRPVEAVWTYPTNYNSSDPLRGDWYKPEVWFVMGKQIHASRLLTFIGREVPDLLKPAYSFGGLSLSQMAKPYIDNWLRTRQSVSDIINSFNVFVLKSKLGNSLMMGGDQVFRRAEMFNAGRDNLGVMMLDMDTEDFASIAAPLSSLDALQAQTQEHMSAVCGIPLVKLLGITPSGLNASSDGEIRSFYDWIHAYQQHLFARNLRTVLGFVQLSTFGSVDPSIDFEFESLWALDEKGQAEVRKIEAETDQILIDSGVLSQEESRNRVANDPDTPYAGLDAHDLPDLREEEIEGLEPQGGRPDPALMAEKGEADEPRVPRRSPKPKDEGGAPGWTLKLHPSKDKDAD